jgi:hypothetical protein
MAGARGGAHDEPVTERSLAPGRWRQALPAAPSLTTVVAATAAVIVAVVVVAVVASALLALIGVAIPFVLVGVGAMLIADDRPVLGWSSVGVGGVLLLGQLPWIALLAGVAALGWYLARR